MTSTTDTTGHPDVVEISDLTEGLLTSPGAPTYVGIWTPASSARTSTHRSRRSVACWALSPAHRVCRTMSPTASMPHSPPKLY